MARVRGDPAVDGRSVRRLSAARCYTARPAPPPKAGEAQRALRAWGGEGAVEHLFLVAAGLDSARVGETEIAGKIRDARKRSRDAGVLGSRLDRVLEEDGLLFLRYVRA